SDGRCLWESFVFFFQAEDGIRDLIVTGVQTCALPICARGSCASSRRPAERREEAHEPRARVGQVARDRVEVREQRRQQRDRLVEIGRASCRERVWSWGGAVYVRKKQRASRW